ncbi:hypothetical protein NC651_035247 [Populus alba x Populus x berolinensis]|nr:hypothetical protein NC651_035247 [Populus alba x Populus x berolinensis]
MADGFNGVGVLSLFGAMVMSVVVFGQGGCGGFWAGWLWWLRMDVECWAVILDSGRVAWCWILRAVVISLWKRVGWSGYWTGGWPFVGSVKGRPVVAGWCREED